MFQLLFLFLLTSWNTAFFTSKEQQILPTEELSENSIVLSQSEIDFLNKIVASITKCAEQKKFAPLIKEIQDALKKEHIENVLGKSKTFSLVSLANKLKEIRENLLANQETQAWALDDFIVPTTNFKSALQFKTDELCCIIGTFGLIYLALQDNYLSLEFPVIKFKGQLPPDFGHHKYKIFHQLCLATILSPQYETLFEACCASDTLEPYHNSLAIIYRIYLLAIQSCHQKCLDSLFKNPANIEKDCTFLDPTDQTKILREQKDTLDSTTTYSQTANAINHLLSNINYIAKGLGFIINESKNNPNKKTNYTLFCFLLSVPAYQPNIFSPSQLQDMQFILNKLLILVILNSDSKKNDYFTVQLEETLNYLPHPSDSWKKDLQVFLNSEHKQNLIEAINSYEYAAYLNNKKLNKTKKPWMLQNCDRLLQQLSIICCQNQINQFAEEHKNEKAHKTAEQQAKVNAEKKIKAQAEEAARIEEEQEELEMELKKIALQKKAIQLQKNRWEKIEQIANRTQQEAKKALSRNFTIPQRKSHTIKNFLEKKNLSYVEHVARKNAPQHIAHKGSGTNKIQPGTSQQLSEQPKPTTAFRQQKPLTQPRRPGATVQRNVSYAQAAKGERPTTTSSTPPKSITVNNPTVELGKAENKPAQLQRKINFPAIRFDSNIIENLSLFLSRASLDSPNSTASNYTNMSQSSAGQSIALSDWTSNVETESEAGSVDIYQHQRESNKPMNRQTQNHVSHELGTSMEVDALDSPGLADHEHRSYKLENEFAIFYRNCFKFLKETIRAVDKDDRKLKDLECHVQTLDQFIKNPEKPRQNQESNHPDFVKDYLLTTYQHDPYNLAQQRFANPTLNHKLIKAWQAMEGLQFSAYFKVHIMIDILLPIFNNTILFCLDNKISDLKRQDKKITQSSFNMIWEILCLSKVQRRPYMNKFQQEAKIYKFFCILMGSQ